MIYLAEAVKLKSILRNKIHELEEEIDRVAFATVLKSEPNPSQKRTLQDVENELSRVRKDSRKLDALIYRANIDHTLEFNNEQLPIVEAIELATQLRAQLAKLKELATAEKEELLYGYGNESQPFYRRALFDPEDYRMKAIELEKQTHQLSNAINAKNYQIQLDFDDSFYF